MMMKDPAAFTSKGRQVRSRPVRRSARGEGGRSRGGRELFGLVQASQQVMAEQTLEGTLRKAAESSRLMSGAAWCACGHEFPQGTFQVALSPGEGGFPLASGEEIRRLYRGAARPELSGQAALRLNGRELARRLASWSPPPPAAPAPPPSTPGGLLAARLQDHRGEPVGLLIAGKAAGSGFTSRDETVIQQFASTVSLALQHLCAHEDAEREIRERTAVADRRTRQLQALAIELSEAEETERQRIGGLLHDDLQQLLASVRFQLKVLQRFVQAGGTSETLVGRIHGLLDESLLKCRQLSEELSPPVLHLGGLSMAMEWLAGRMKSKHGLSVQVDMEEWNPLEDEPLRIFLFRTVQELLLNVVKHSGSRAARVRLRSDGERAEITVADDGRGFEPRVVEGRSGSGLLSITERVRFLGGSMDIESNPGLGSRLHLTLPLQGAIRQLDVQPDRESPHSVRPGPAAEGGDGGSRTGHRLQVLLADDHQLMRQGLSTLLGNAPDILVVGEAANGREAIERARRLHPDVILMDVSMPGMDGIEATRRIKAEMPEVRVIGLSMFEEGEVAKRMREAGAEAYLSKSDPAEQLIEAIRRLSEPADGAAAAP